VKMVGFRAYTGALIRKRPNLYTVVATECRRRGEIRVMFEAKFSDFVWVSMADR